MSLYIWLLLSDPSPWKLVCWCRRGGYPALWTRPGRTFDQDAFEFPGKGVDTAWYV